MTETLRDYNIVSRYLVREHGWKVETVEVRQTTLAAAWREASRLARDLDGTYGSDHFWTVDVKNPAGESYVQLFHGRLS